MSIFRSLMALGVLSVMAGAQSTMIGRTLSVSTLGPLRIRSGSERTIRALGSGAGVQSARTADVPKGLVRELRHEMLSIASYDVFDWLEAEVRTDGAVILRGQVVEPTIKSEAEARAKGVEGVERVVNEIEVLPTSPNDDRLRRALYRTIFSSNSQLFRYAHRAVPPIHIIVKNGRATLKGVVSSEQDKQLAYMKARSVPGLFEVRNELQVGK